MCVCVRVHRDVFELHPQTSNFEVFPFSSHGSAGVEKEALAAGVREIEKQVFLALETHLKDETGFGACTDRRQQRARNKDG